MLKHAGAYRAAAMAWVQDRPGQWKTYLVRVDLRTKKPTVTPLIWVHPDAPLCVRCLSQYVDLDVSHEPVAVVCLDPTCGARTQVDLDDDLDEDDDEDLDLDDDGDDTDYLPPSDFK